MIARLLDRNPRLANWIWGFTPPERGTVVLVHRRVYILPTRLGWLFAATLTILLIFSTGIILYSGLFTGPESDFLMASPIPDDQRCG